MNSIICSNFIQDADRIVSKLNGADIDGSKIVGMLSTYLVLLKEDLLANTPFFQWSFLAAVLVLLVAAEDAPVAATQAPHRCIRRPRPPPSPTTAQKVNIPSIPRG